MQKFRLLLKTEYVVLFLLCFLTIYGENYLPFLKNFASIGFHAFELICSVFFLFFIVVFVVLSRRGKVFFSSSDIFFLFFFAWNIVTLFYSSNLHLGFRSIFQIFLFYLILFYFSNVSIPPNFLKTSLDAFLVLIVLNLLLVIYQFFHPINPEYYYFGVIRSAGLTSGCNGLAFLCLYLICLFLPCAIFWRKIYYLPVLLLILLIVFSQTRVALVILFILIAFYVFWFRAFLGKSFYLFLFFGLIVVLYFLHSFVFLFGHITKVSAINSSLLNDINEIGTLRHRLFIWHMICFEFLKNYFLGMGLGSTESFLRNLPGSISLDAVHNEYLKILSDTGVIGLFFFLLWFFSLLLSSYKMLKFVRSCKLSRFYLILSLAGFCSLVVFGLGCLFHNLIYTHEISAIGFFIVGMNYSVNGRLRRSYAQKASFNYTHFLQ